VARGHAGRRGAQRGVDEYAKLVGAAAATGQKSALPAPADVGAQALVAPDRSVLRRGPNDKGIGIQLAYSLARVLIGFCWRRWSRSRSAS
jgi:hypothetical protein